MSESSLGHMPESPKWKFDESVTACFDDMLQRSIPQHGVMRDAVDSIAARHIQPATTVIDLGCSWGRALKSVRDTALKFGADRGGIKFEGLEISAPMIRKARAEFCNASDVEIHEQNIRDWTPAPGEASVVLAVLTLLFAPINYRQQIIRAAWSALLPGGCFIVVEKVLGEGPHIDDVLVDRYREMKIGEGYSVEEIDAKQAALEGVQVPVTASMTEQMLRGAAFREVDCFWRWMNFAGWLAVK